MIKGFKKGHFYRWIGSKERPWAWNPSGKMDKLLTGESFLCTGASKDGEEARFEGIPLNSPSWNICWSFSSTLDNFEEVFETKPEAKK